MRIPGALVTAALFLAATGAWTEPADPSPPWSTDVEATRKAALEANEPCVILVNVNAGAL